MEQMTKRSSQRRNVKSRNVSLPPAYDAAVEMLASRAGHKNASRVIQDLIAREARAEIGRDWQIVVIGDPANAAAEAVPA